MPLLICHSALHEQQDVSQIGCRPERSVRTRAAPSTGQARQKRELSWEERFFAEYRPPQLVPNKYVLVAGLVLAVGLAGTLLLK